MSTRRLIKEFEVVGESDPMFADEEVYFIVFPTEFAKGEFYGTFNVREAANMISGYRQTGVLKPPEGIFNRGRLYRPLGWPEPIKPISVYMLKVTDYLCKMVTDIAVPDTDPRFHMTEIEEFPKETVLP